MMMGSRVKLPPPIELEAINWMGLGALGAAVDTAIARLEADAKAEPNDKLRSDVVEYIARQHTETMAAIEHLTKFRADIYRLCYEAANKELGR